MPLSNGARLGPYEILAFLGAGGMGEVYRAGDTRLGREVAIKILASAVAADPERLRRFEQEARAVAALNHPNILALFDIGAQDGTHYLVTELLEGESLRVKLGEGALSVRRTLEYASQIATGLAAAHDRGIVHRDLKPDNVFITKDARVKILDFGLAKLSPALAAAVHAETVTFTGPQTSAGMLVGTAGYMSPEQVRGEAADHRTDIFAFGAVLYEMVSGQRAFQRHTSAETMTAVLKEDPPELAESAKQVPPALDRIIRRCLEKQPERRFQSAKDLGFALENLSGSSVSVPVMAAPARRQSLRFGLPALAVVLAILAGGLWFSAEAPVGPTRFVQLTNDSYMKGHVGWPPPVTDSPLVGDGARLYLSLQTPSGIKPAQVSSKGGEVVPMTVALPDQSILMGISPDGSELLVETAKSEEVEVPQWEVPVLGGSPHRIDDLLAHDLAWSPDKQTLAYAAGDGLYLLTGNERRKLYTAAGLVMWPRWSRDGKRLRFTVNDPLSISSALWEVDGDGRHAHMLLPGWNKPAMECCGDWTADGRYYVFQTGTFHDAQIWAVRDGAWWGNDKPFAVTAGPLSFSSAWPDREGRHLYVIGTQRQAQVVRVEAQNNQLLPFPNLPSVLSLDFSRDGQWVAYATYPEGTLWRSRLDGSDRLQLTYSPILAASPAWSPDGKQIAFVALRAGKPAQLQIVPAEGGSAQPVLPEARSQGGATWAPDGQSLIFGRMPFLEGANPRPAPLVRVDLKTHRAEELPGSDGLKRPVWSPDGKFVAASHGDTTRPALYDLTTHTWRALADDVASRVAWSHDGTAVYFQVANSKIVRYVMATGRVENVASAPFMLSADYWVEDSTLFVLGPHDTALLLRFTGSSQVYALDWPAR